MSFNFLRRSPQQRDEVQTDEPYVPDISHVMQTPPNSDTPTPASPQAGHHYGALQPQVAAGSNYPVRPWQEEPPGPGRAFHTDLDDYDAPESFEVDYPDTPDDPPPVEAESADDPPRDHFAITFDNAGEQDLPAETYTTESPAEDLSAEPTPLFTEVRGYTTSANNEGPQFLQSSEGTEHFDDSSSEETDPRSETKENTMSANIQASLRSLLEIEGATGAAIVDIASGMELGTGGSPNFDLNVAAAGNSNVIRAKLATIADLGINEHIEDIMITLESQYHLLSVLNTSATEGLFIYLVLDRRHANLALARHKLRKLSEQISV